jgi:hypothetical protein
MRQCLCYRSLHKGISHARVLPRPPPRRVTLQRLARFGDQVRYPNRGDITRELFGSKSDHALVDWSCSLGHLVGQLPADHCYTVDTLISDHTLLPLYAPFLPPQRRQRLYDQMIGGNGTALSARLGILTSHIPPHKWLRFCPACAKSDRERFGETYWHRLHQAPGVEVCPIHAVFLEDSTTAKQSGKRAFISAESAVQTVQPRPAADDPLCRFMLDVAEYIDQLLRNVYASPGESFLRRQYLALLDRHGLITLKGSVRVVEFLKALTDYYPPAFLSLLHCELNRTKHIEAEWAARLPFARRPQHPLHHILVLLFLGVPVDAFFSSPIQPPRPFGEGPWPCLNSVCEHYRASCITDYAVRANSSKNRPVGLFTCPSCGFTYSRVGPDRIPEDIFRRDRIPAYGHLWQEKLREWWIDPEVSTERIARCLGTDFNTVKRQAKRLALPPRRDSRQRSTRDPLDGQKLAENREEWLQLMELHSQEGITALTRRSNRAHAIYNWLNKHDRQWLLLHRPPAKMPQRTKAHLRATFRTIKEAPDKSRREERDASASQAIRFTAQQITNFPGEPRRVTRAQLEKAAPGVGWLLSNPENFPLTAQAFCEARETREAFALRRIQWALQRYKEESIRPTRKEFVQRAKAKRLQDALSVRSSIEEALASLASI